MLLPTADALNVNTNLNITVVSGSTYTAVIGLTQNFGLKILSSTNMSD